jgi:D-3-phosphoglycerate dehydrogenase
VRRITVHDRRVRAGEWNITAGNPIFRMTGRNYGIIGYGRTGRNVHRLIRGFDFKTIYVCSPSADDVALRKEGAVKVDLKTLLRESDFVSCHVPLNAGTERLLGAKEFGCMKPTAVFVNTARGRVIDQNALIEALKNKTIAAAGLDVFETEPIPRESELFTLGNVVLTDHQAWYSEESIVELKGAAARNIVAVLTGKGAASIVN